MQKTKGCDILEDIINGLCVCIDWLTFVIDDSYNAVNVCDMLGLQFDEFTMKGSGARGYKNVYEHYTGIRMYTNGTQENMGTCVECSAGCINYLINSFSRSSTSIFGDCVEVDEFCDYTITAFFRKINSVGHFTRIDIAIDDFGSKYYTVSSLKAEFVLGKVVKRFKKYEHIIGYGKNNQIIGNTLYIGSRQSEIFVRVYDKQLEQNVKREKENQIYYSWTRWEMEIKGDNAYNTALLIADNDCIGRIGIGILANYMRIVNLDNDVLSRCSNDELWDCFIKDCEKLRISRTKEESNLAKKEKWVQKSVLPSIAAICKSRQGDMEFIYKDLETNYYRNSKKIIDEVQFILEKST